MDAQLAAYVTMLQHGGVIACATETQFGLLADARSAQAIAEVVAIKQRGAEPIALLVPDLACATSIAEFDASARALAERHWPGPLTLVLRLRADLPAATRLPAALLRDGTIGLRVPGPSPALELVRAFQGPLTATSCNPSGQPAAHTADQARAYFGDRLAAILPEPAPGGPPSTIVDVTGAELRVLRRGAVQL
jgi:L-threonylcarbamoyladenylate synthase